LYIFQGGDIHPQGGLAQANNNYGMISKLYQYKSKNTLKNACKIVIGKIVELLCKGTALFLFFISV